MRNFIAKRTRGRRSMRLTDWWDTVTCLGLPEAPFESERDVERVVGGAVVGGAGDRDEVEIAEDVAAMASR